jgi:hypothetical protein
MFNRLITLITLLVMPLQTIGDVLTVRKDAPQRYVVKKGDTLWDLSGIYLTDPVLWPKLWRFNPQIKNPHLIYPGDVIGLTYDAQGVPILSINSKVIRLSPKKRITPKSKIAIPTLPLKLIRPYLTYDQSLDGQYLDTLPYLLGSDGSNKKWIDGQILYVNEPLKNPGNYAIYRKGQAYTNIGKKRPLGYQTELVGIAKLLRTGDDNGEPAAIKVTTALSEIKAGDKVLPINEGQSLPVFFKMAKPQVLIEATIIASPEHYRQFSHYDVVVLNAGLAQQAQVGNLLDIYHQSPLVIDTNKLPKYYDDASTFERFASDIEQDDEQYTSEETAVAEESAVAVAKTEEDGDDEVATPAKKMLRHMPKEKIGQLMIFKVYQNISYALIITTSKPAVVGDTTFVSLKRQTPEVSDEAGPEQNPWFFGDSDEASR